MTTPISSTAEAAREQHRDPSGKFGTQPSTEAELDLTHGGVPAPATPKDVTVEHLRAAMTDYLDATAGGQTYEEWAESLDYEDGGFGGDIERAVFALNDSGLPGAKEGVATADEEAATIDIGVTDPVHNRQCTRYAQQREFWNEDAEPTERADYLLEQAYSDVVQQQSLLDAHRERDTRLATMQRSMTWQLMPPRDMATRQDTLRAAYPGLTEDESLIGAARLIDARDEIERMNVLSDLQATSDERSIGAPFEHEEHLATSREAFTRAMKSAGPYQRSVATFVGATLGQHEVEDVCLSHRGKASFNIFWDKARMATSRPRV